MKINFGCGTRELSGYVNLDKEQCDLEKLPLPFPSESVEEIYCSHVLEHLAVKPSIIMKDFLRILKPGGAIVVLVPHFSWHNAFDEDHERFFNHNSFSFLHKSNLEKIDYAHIHRKVTIRFFKRYFFWNYIIEPIVNLNSRAALLYESTFLCHLFPANELVFEIRKKNTP